MECLSFFRKAYTRVYSRNFKCSINFVSIMKTNTSILYHILLERVYRLQKLFFINQKMHGIVVSDLIQVIKAS